MAEIIAKYCHKPANPKSTEAVISALRRQRVNEKRRQLYGDKPRTPTKYGTVKCKSLFPAIADRIGISAAAARNRYYRNAIPVEIVAELSK